MIVITIQNISNSEQFYSTWKWPDGSNTKMPNNDPLTDRPTVLRNESRLRSWGERNISLQFGLHRFAWPFRLANVDNTFLGADFLAANNLLVDVARHRLLDAATLQPLAVHSVSSIPDSAIYTAPLCVSNEYRKVPEDTRKRRQGSPTLVNPTSNSRTFWKQQEQHGKKRDQRSPYETSRLHTERISAPHS